MTTRVLSTPPKIALGIHFHGYGTKTTPVFLLVDWEASWLLLPCLVSPHSQAAQCYQKTPIPASSRLQDRSGSQKKDRHQNLSQLPPVFITPVQSHCSVIKIQFQPTQYEKMGFKADQCNKHLHQSIFIVTPSLAGGGGN